LIPAIFVWEREDVLMKFVCLAEHKLNCPIHLNGGRRAKNKKERRKVNLTFAPSDST